MNEELKTSFLNKLTAFAADPHTPPHVLDQALIRVHFFLTSRRYLGLTREATFAEHEPRSDD